MADHFPEEEPKPLFRFPALRFLVPLLTLTMLQLVVVVRFEPTHEEEISAASSAGELAVLRGGWLLALVRCRACRIDCVPLPFLKQRRVLIALPVFP